MPPSSPCSARSSPASPPGSQGERAWRCQQSRHLLLVKKYHKPSMVWRVILVYTSGRNGEFWGWFAVALLLFILREQGNDFLPSKKRVDIWQYNFQYLGELKYKINHFKMMIFDGRSKVYFGHRMEVGALFSATNARSEAIHHRIWVGIRHRWGFVQSWGFRHTLYCKMWVGPSGFNLTVCRHLINKVLKKAPAQTRALDDFSHL